MAVKVGFKRGTQAALNTLNTSSTAVDGVFYLTTDTNRMYVGTSTNKAIPISEGINFVANVAALPAVTPETLSEYSKSFYYASQENILCIHNGTQWIQINPDTDTKLTGVAYSVDVVGGKATVTVTETLSNSSTKTGAFSIEGEDGASVTATGTAIKIKAPKVDSVTITNKASGGYTFGVKDSVSSAAKTADFDPVVYVGEDNTKTNNQIHFSNGVATLPVYSKEEVDKKLQTLDAMTFRGVKNSSTEIDMNKVHNGDTFKAGAAFTIGTVAFSVGDLIIAEGTESATTGYIPSANITWNKVSASDGTGSTPSVTYSGAGITHGLKISDSDGVLTGSLALATEANSALTLTDSGSGNTKTVTVNHNKPTVSDTTGTAKTQSNHQDLTFNTITGVTRDSYGHVSGVETTTVKITALEWETF